MGKFQIFALALACAISVANAGSSCEELKKSMNERLEDPSMPACAKRQIEQGNTKEEIEGKTEEEILELAECVVDTLEWAKENDIPGAKECEKGLEKYMQEE